MEEVSAPEPRIEQAPAPESARGAKRLVRILGMASLVIYIVSFALPYQDSSLGAKVFLYGLLYCWWIPITTPWWANVVYWVALRTFFRGRPLYAGGYACAAVIIGSFHLLMAPPQWAPGLAFYCWLGSMAFLAVGGLALIRRSQVNEIVSREKASFRLQTSLNPKPTVAVLLGFSIFIGFFLYWSLAR